MEEERKKSSYPTHNKLKSITEPPESTGFLAKMGPYPEFSSFPGSPLGEDATTPQMLGKHFVAMYPKDSMVCSFGSKPDYLQPEISVCSAIQ